MGLKAVLKTTGAEKGIIVIEDNKPDAIELVQKKVADIGNMEVFVAKTKYPQGAEKTLIKRVMGRIVPSGGLPADVGDGAGNGHAFDHSARQLGGIEVVGVFQPHALQAEIHKKRKRQNLQGYFRR